jgi:hypothetical protein
MFDAVAGWLVKHTRISSQTFFPLFYCAVGPSLRMFDAVAGWLVKRVRSRHVQAPSSPQQLAAVAAVYARLQHRSVVVPELLNALDMQVGCGAAAGDCSSWRVFRAAVAAWLCQSC